jgi:hypothetical protein
MLPCPRTQEEEELCNLKCNWKVTTKGDSCKCKRSTATGESLMVTQMEQPALPRNRSGSAQAQAHTAPAVRIEKPHPPWANGCDEVHLPSVRRYAAQPSWSPGFWHTGSAAWLRPGHSRWALRPWQRTPSCFQAEERWAENKTSPRQQEAERRNSNAFTVARTHSVLKRGH